MDADADDKWVRRLERERHARRQAELLAEQGMRELWHVNQNLEQLVSERTRALDRSLAALEHAGHVRQALLADLGHELATPLHAITGYLELLDTKGLSGDDRDRVALARASAARLDGLLRAVLAVADVGPRVDRTDTERRRPGEVLDELVDRWQLRAARRGQLLVGAVEAGEEPVEADWHRLITAADAILDACVQFAAPGPLHVEVVSNADGVTIAIEDSGPALAPSVSNEPHPTPLTWASAGRRGIGLAVAQRIADESRMTLSITRADVDGVRAVARWPCQSEVAAGAEYT